MWVCLLSLTNCGCVQAEHKLVESAWPTSMRNLLGPNSILTAGKKGHKQQRQILSQVGLHAQGFLSPWSCHPSHVRLQIRMPRWQHILATARDLL